MEPVGENVAPLTAQFYRCDVRAAAVTVRGRSALQANSAFRPYS